MVSVLYHFNMISLQQKLADEHGIWQRQQPSASIIAASLLSGEPSPPSLRLRRGLRTIVLVKPGLPQQFRILYRLVRTAHEAGNQLKRDDRFFAFVLYLYQL